ncbi:AAA-ATPase [Quillaja saponaria]|uniref:AAA-ATPase n=1 Tax=Quillaja saponaria TaxID=32244 RepID=A0AAD7PK71_QUISA|nr:AAA-ATPase [Quillaja saponaria]
MFRSETRITTEAVISVVAPIVTGAVLLRSIVNELVPNSASDYLVSRIRNFYSKRFSSQITVIVQEFDGLIANQMFEAANIYLGEKLSPTAQRFKVDKPLKEEQFKVTVDKELELFDSYEGAKIKWVLVSSLNEKPATKNQSIERSEVRHFELSFRKRHRDMVLSSYLPHVLQEAKIIKEVKKTVKLHTIDYNGTDYWSSINLNHPATFDTMALEPEMRKELIEDLDRFIARKEYYRKVGRAWKRGYLLYGPPGTGKSSLVAAMANHLKFDVYDLDLGEVQCNSDLRRLLIGMGNKSILVIEDIDCSVDLQNRESDNKAQLVDDDKITLSAVLNFIDGLWSSCGDERIVVCTTNRKERLDPALLRPGRMDLHLHMSYCSFSGFKTLAENYLGIQEHPLFEDIGELLDKVEATPAEVAGELMKSNDAEIALKGLMDFLQKKQDENHKLD